MKSHIYPLTLLWQFCKSVDKMKTEIILSQNNVMPLVRENLWNVRRGWFLTFSEGFSFILRRKVFAIAVKVLGKEPFYELELAF